MKNLSLLILLLFIIKGHVYSQKKSTFLINIMDEKEIVSVVKNRIQVKVRFKDKNINELLDQYEIYTFERAYPSARLASTLRIWKIESNNLKLMKDLLAIDNNLFLDGTEVKPPVLTYSPNDYGLVPQVHGQKDLDLINAKQAWDITKGDPSIVIGVADNGFDVSHEDLENQIVQIRSGVDNGGTHGTSVAGALAAQTDNNKGISAIGFNCKLDIANYVLNDVHLLSLDGRKVINCSWYNSCTPRLSDRLLSDEIYENGTLVVWGAGNGYSIRRDSLGNRKLHKNHCNRQPTYPPAYPHNIAVSSVGSDVDYGELS